MEWILALDGVSTEIQPVYGHRQIHHIVLPSNFSHSIVAENQKFIWLGDVSVLLADKNCFVSVIGWKFWRNLLLLFWSQMSDFLLHPHNLAYLIWPTYGHLYSVGQKGCGILKVWFIVLHLLVNLWSAGSHFYIRSPVVHVV